jgi:hypothetical protein
VFALLAFFKRVVTKLPEFAMQERNESSSGQTNGGTRRHRRRLTCISNQCMKTLTKIAFGSLLAATILVGCSQQSSENSAEAQIAYSYAASVARAPFHRISCTWATRISPQNLQMFRTREEAIKAGHRPCKVCRP